MVMGFKGLKPDPDPNLRFMPGEFPSLTQFHTPKIHYQ